MRILEVFSNTKDSEGIHFDDEDLGLNSKGKGKNSPQNTLGKSPRKSGKTFKNKKKKVES